jgi:hypothetical protein
MWRILLITLWSLLLATGYNAVAAPVSPGEYGLQFVPDKKELDTWIKARMDSTLKLDKQGQEKHIIYQVAKDRPTEDRTPDFYFLLSLCLFLGLLRFTSPHYFSILIRSFRNPSGSRHFKEQIQGAAMTNFLMNVFFSVIIGTYIYYTGRVFAFRFSQAFDGPLMVLSLIGGILAIYLGKYFVIRFSGWAFRVETITEQYLFNVFLINKIIGILLLPFVILLAFCDKEWAGSLVIVSLLLTGLLIFNRYARSWNVFGSFFQYSRFHFFTYLCASEILPMAILLKLLLRTMA